MQTFRELFNEIQTTDQEQSRLAARAVRKLLYNSHQQFSDLKVIIANAPVEYSKITEDFRQENFVLAISVIYFLHDREERPDFLFLWFFQLLQHENGYIRHAAVRMIEHELGPLTYYLRFPDNKSDIHTFSGEIADQILFRLYFNLNNLASRYWQPRYKRYKYVDSLPIGIYKSIQMILSRLEEDCGAKKFTEFQSRMNQQ